MAVLKLINNLQFYFEYLVSGFVNGGSWKLNRIIELDCVETRKILVRNMSTYEELFAHREKMQHQ